jgi:hypothetical protein
MEEVNVTEFYYGQLYLSCPNKKRRRLKEAIITC